MKKIDKSYAPYMIVNVPHSIVTDKRPAVKTDRTATIRFGLPCTATISPESLRNFKHSRLTRAQG